MMVEHYAKATARPWKVRDDVTAWATWLSDETEASDIGEIGEGWSIDSMPEAEANAALIVHAVNNIEAREARIVQLEAALEQIATVDHGGGFLGALACRQVASAALRAKAGQP